MRYVKSPFIGFELTYSLNPFDQSYSPDKATCGFTCSNPPETIPDKTSEFGVDWVVSKRSGSIRPFALGGFGFLVNAATGDAYAINTIVRPGYIYGGGADWGTGHWGLRAQYRGTFYKAPNLTSVYFPTGKFAQTAEPMIGVYYRR